ncbi:putative TPR domain protein [Paratrimastix pyriformis]|uniref:TPR domain protein n=1 Tax=Paratrimastix pyriformis TaxID=342808 RepID=A0ABQ8UV20_9EUKA|nr:putative TPR domain protein [Paratrimastix pyriformis]
MDDQEMGGVIDDGSRTNLNAQWKIIADRWEDSTSECEGDLPIRDTVMDYFQLALVSHEELVATHSIRSSIRPSFSLADVPLVNPQKQITIRECVKRCNHLHTGFVLNATVIRPPLTVVATNLLLEDENGDVIILAVYHPAVDPTEFRVGTRVAVIAPYAKFPRNDRSLPPMLRTDNPHAVVILTPSTPPPAEPAEVMLTRATEAFQASRFREATGCLTRAQQTAPGNIDLLAKRSDSQLAGGWWAGALQDARAVLEREPGHYQANCNAALALVGLQRPVEAHPYLDALRAMSGRLTEGRRAEITALIADVERCCCEARGVYDMRAMHAEARAARGGRLGPRHCDFISPAVEPRPVASKGRGVFAKEDLAEGTLLMACRALVFAEPDQGPVSYAMFGRRNVDLGPTARLVPLAVRFLIEHPERADEVLELTATGEEPAEKEDVDGGRGQPRVDLARIEQICEVFVYVATVDTYGCVRVRVRVSPVTDLLATRGVFADQATAAEYALPELIRLTKASAGLWGKPSLFNHSCLPTCAWEAVGDFMFVRTILPVRAGDELCTAYIDVSMSPSVREASFRALGFDCICERCNFFRQYPAYRDLEEPISKLVAFQHLTLATAIGHAMGLSPPRLMPDELALAGLCCASGLPDQSERILRRLRGGVLAGLEDDVFLTAVMQLGTEWEGDPDRKACWRPQFEEIARRVGTGGGADADCRHPLRATSPLPPSMGELSPSVHLKLHAQRTKYRPSGSRLVGSNPPGRLGRIGYFSWRSDVLVVFSNGYKVKCDRVRPATTQDIDGRFQVHEKPLRGTNKCDNRVVLTCVTRGTKTCNNGRVLTRVTAGSSGQLIEATVPCRNPSSTQKPVHFATTRRRGLPDEKFALVLLRAVYRRNTPLERGLGQRGQPLMISEPRKIKLLESVVEAGKRWKLVKLLDVCDWFAVFLCQNLAQIAEYLFELAWGVNTRKTGTYASSTPNNQVPMLTTARTRRHQGVWGLLTPTVFPQPVDGDRVCWGLRAPELPALHAPTKPVKPSTTLTATRYSPPFTITHP